MSNFRKFMVFAAVLMVAAACGKTAKIDASVEGVSSSDILIKVLRASALEVVDTVALDEAGKLSYEMEIEDGQVEFVYLYRGSRKLASMLLQQGDKVSVKTDTFGVYSVVGSDESEKLVQVEKDYAAFLKKVRALSSGITTYDKALEAQKELGKEYVNYYRDRVKYIMANSRSMTVVPVLYQTFGSNLPVFAQPTDAIHFKNMADSLALSYPESRYVKALRKEAERRMGRLELQSLLNSAEQIAYPEIELPDINGQKRKLSEVEAKVIIIQFWTATNLEQKIFNIDVLKPLYEEFHSTGLEIYQVSLDADKVLWAQTVKQQAHPWVSVCDSRGTASPFAASYNLQILPSMFVIADGALVDGKVVDEASLKKLVHKLLK